MKYIVIFLLLSITQMHSVSAQDRKVHIGAYTGVYTQVLNNGLGLLVGLNGTYHYTDFFSIESVIQYNHINLSKFLSGRNSVENSYSILGGGRLYPLNPKNKFQIYANLLLGYNYLSIPEDDLYPDGKKINRLGLSFGIFTEFNRRFFTGLALESDGLTLKAGFNFL